MPKEEEPILTPDNDSEELFGEGLVEFTTNAEYIRCAADAITAVDSLDPMTTDGKAMKNRILTRCFKIIDLCVEEMYSELFDPAADD